MRKPIVAGNWKMNKTVDEAVHLAEGVKTDLADCTYCDVVLCAPFTVLKAVADVIETCLSRDPEARFKTSAEFARALRGAAGATCGLADRSEVTSLVQAYGGQGLEKTQTQLRLALEGAPRPSVEPLRPSGDLASGIIVREPDGTFESDEAPTSVSSSLPAHTASGGSRLRLLVAASVVGPRRQRPPQARSTVAAAARETR